MNTEIELWIDVRCRLEAEERRYIESIQGTFSVTFVHEGLESVEDNGAAVGKKGKYAIDQKYIVYLSDNPQRIRQAKTQGYPVIVYLRENTPLDASAYAVTSLLAIDEEYLTWVYCHSKGIPQVITTTDRLIIREMVMSDLDALLEIYETNEKTVFFQAFYDNKEEAAVYLADYIKNVYDFYGYGIWGICLRRDEEKIIGIIGFTPRKDALEMGYALAKAYQGKGYIIEARRAVMEYAEDKLDECNILEITNHS